MTAPAKALHDVDRRKPWAVVNNHPHQHSVACANLERQEFEAYCPMVARSVRHARRTQDVLRPLFPGYLFVRINPDAQRWRVILSTFGVRSLVRVAGSPALVDEGLVESLKGREKNGVIVKPAAPYQLGQKLKIAGSAFDGMVGTIIELDEKDRVTVLLEFLNRPVRVQLNAGGAVEV